MSEVFGIAIIVFGIYQHVILSRAGFFNDSYSSLVMNESTTLFLSLGYNVVVVLPSLDSKRISVGTVFHPYPYSLA